MSHFVHLHVHSDHSPLDAVPTIDEIVNRAAEMNQSAICISDHGNVSGHFLLQRAAERADIKPIFSLEGYFTEDRRIKDGKKGQGTDHITVHAINDKGLSNLWALSSRAYIEGLYYDPRMDWELLEEHKDGLAVGSACLGGVIAEYLKPGEPNYDPEKAWLRAARLQQIFGENFFLELHTFSDGVQEAVNHELVRLGSELSIPLIAVSDSHYLYPDDSDAHDLIFSLSIGKDIYDPTRYQFGHDQLALYSEDVVRQRLAYLGQSVVDEAVANTGAFADKCDAQIKPVRSMPVFFDSPKTDSEKLTELAWAGLEWRYARIESSYPKSIFDARLRYELEIIESKGYAGYFLMVEDIVRWAKSESILVGAGRGSCGGSLLAYTLGIIEIDPLRGNLIFERFLDPGRDSLPDIDLDFPRDARPKVREYIENKYGRDHVATIGTISTSKPKILLRDLCRGLKIPLHETVQMLRIVDAMPDLNVAQIKTTWADIEAKFALELAPWKRQYPRLFESLHIFEGHARHRGGHPSGMVVSKESLIGQLPLSYKSKAPVDVRTQMDFVDVDALGFVKLDILGLRTLQTMQQVINIVKDRHGPKAPPHVYEWQYEWDKYYEDPKVLASLGDGKNIGVFQLETAGLRQLAKRFKIASFDDICTIISIFRPGITRAFDEETGLNLLDLYMERRAGNSPICYKHPLLKPILESTAGSFCFQEQIMQCVQSLAGFSLSEADQIRSILAKKKVEAMAAKQTAFVEGCEAANNIPPSLAKSIWHEMAQFAKYAFNRAHGYGYAILALWMAWYKCYYPQEFMLALFRTNNPAASVYARECHAMGIPLLTPDINESNADFTLTAKGTIRYGLERIKWMGSWAKKIEEARDNVEFASMEDFIERNKGINRRAVQGAILVGAMDSLISPEDQAEFPTWSPKRIALWQYIQLRGGKEAKTVDDQCTKWSTELCDSWHSNFEHFCEELKVDDLIANESEYLGSVLSFDPLGPYMQLISRIENFRGTRDMFVGEITQVGGIISAVRLLVTKKGKSPGQKMCALTLDLPVVEANLGDAELSEVDVEDNDGQIEVVVFPQQFSRFKESIQVNAPVVLDVAKLKDGGLCLQGLYRLDKIGT